MDATAVQLLVIELVLIAMLAVLSAAEAAIYVVRRPQVLEALATRGRRGRRAGALGERSIRYLAAMQVLEFLTIFAYAAVAAAFIAPRLSQYLSVFGVGAALSDWASVAVTVAVFGLLAVWFGIFVPRALGTRYSQQTLLWLVWPIELITWITRPIVALLFALTTAVTRPFGAAKASRILVSEEEIKALVDTAEQQGGLEETERDMIREVLDLGDKRVHEIMVPRPDIRAIDVATSAQELLDGLVSIGHSRIPVFEGSPDQIIGVLYVRDVFRRLARAERQFDLRALLRPAHFVPETKRLDELLREMQRDKLHMAIVVDEYGGTAGLVTIEDIVEEIVGEIRDEYDVEQELVVPVSENEALVDGRTPFEDIRETFALDGLEQSEDYDTLGGFIVHELGRFPRAGEEVKRGDVRFIVETIEARRIRRVRIVREQPQQVEAV